MAQETSTRTTPVTGSVVDNRKSTLSSSASSTTGSGPGQFGEEKEDDITPDKEFAPITRTNTSGLERMSTNERLTQEQLKTLEVECVAPTFVPQG